MLCSGGSSQGSSTRYSAAASSPEQLRRHPPATMCGCRSRTRPGAPAVMTGLLVLAALLAATAAPAADCRLLADSSQDHGTGSKLWQEANGARTSPSAPTSCLCALPTCALVPHHADVANSSYCRFARLEAEACVLAAGRKTGVASQLAFNVLITGPPATFVVQNTCFQARVVLSLLRPSCTQGGI